MNIAIISGRLVKNAVLRGNADVKVLAFTLETRSNDGDKERSNYVPCVLFKPAAEIEALLTLQGKGLLVELEGRVNGSNPDADRKFGTEIIVRNKSLVILEPVIEKA